MSDNIIEFKNPNQVSIKDVVDAMVKDCPQFEEVYVVAWINGQACFYLSGDIRGAVLSGQILTDQALHLMKGEPI